MCKFELVTIILCCHKKVPVSCVKATKAQVKKLIFSSVMLFLDVAFHCYPRHPFLYYLSFTVMFLGKIMECFLLPHYGIQSCPFPILTAIQFQRVQSTLLFNTQQFKFYIYVSIFLSYHINRHMKKIGTLFRRIM